jgi:molecular chaperone GrpE
MIVEKYRARINSLMQAGKTVAARFGHRQIAPLHILEALLDDECELAASLIDACGDDAARTNQEAQRELAQLAGARRAQLHLNPDTTWIFEQAHELSEHAAASLVIADHLLLGLTIESGALPQGVSDTMANTTRKLAAVISGLRGASGGETQNSKLDPGGLKAENAALRDRLLRELAEAENTRRRSERMVEESGRYALAGFSREILPVADNLQRALDAATKHSVSTPAANEALLEGVEVTARMLMDTLARAGIRKIDALGARFDPSVHEAMMQVEDPSHPPGTVTRVVEDGYTIHDRLLRPARVVISKVSPGLPPQSERRTFADLSQPDRSNESR